MNHLKVSTYYPDDDVPATVKAAPQRSELTGDLGDFSLTDILQILSLTRKTGTLSIESDICVGKVVVEDGKITCASVRPGNSFADRLLRENRLSAQALNDLRVFAGDSGVWTLQTLLTESGVLSLHDLEALARRHFQDIIGELIALKEGRFGIDLTSTALPEPLNEVMLTDGVEMGEILLAAASERDEEERIIQLEEAETPSWVDNLKLDSWQSDDEPSYQQRAAVASNVIPFTGQAINRERLTPEERSLLLLSLLTEMRSHTEEIEIILLIMRYASEVATRGVIFFVREDEVSGFGQFGVESFNANVSADVLVRDIRIPVGEGSIFDTVLWTGQPFLGALPQNHHHREMLRKIGGAESDVSAFALPLFRNNEAIIVFYGDNYPDFAELTGFEGLVALVTQASLVLEKLDLERKLNKNTF